jgi:ribosome maturation protein Sdo1
MANRHGNQGTYDSAAKGTLEAEFGTSKEEDAVIQILEKGNLMETEV